MMSERVAQQESGGPASVARAFGIALLVLALYVFYGWRPFVVQTWAVVDDGLYVRHALGILDWLSGKSSTWLGAFDGFLLAKTPLYGMWLAILNVLGVPLRVADFALFVGGAWLLRRAVRPVRVLRTGEFAVVLVLLLTNPALPDDFYLRRTTFHIALTNLCLVAAIGLALRAAGPLRGQWPWALLTGFCFSLCYLNREEASWLLAAVVVAFLIASSPAFFAWRRREHGAWSVVRAAAVPALAFVVGFLPLVTTVCALNRAHYGVFLTTFRRSPALTGLMQRLTSLEPAGHQPYVPIARPTRLKAYALSPTFATLEPYLESRDGYWRAGNEEHAVFNGRKPEEREFFVSYFEFALLKAAVDAGLRHADQVEALFRVIDRELGRAVREKKIAAGASGPAILAAPVDGDYRRIVAAFFFSLARVLFLGPPRYDWPSASGASKAKLNEAAMLTMARVQVDPAPNLHHSLRSPVIRGVKRVQQGLLPLLVAAVPALWLWRRRELRATRPPSRALLLWTLAVPMVALLACCFAMAVVEVLGFKFLATMAYNVLGYAPLSVLCALSFVAWRVFAPRLGRRRAPVADVATAEMNR